MKAAAALFVAKGYNGTSTREIAATAGLRQGSLPHYFPRKQDMLVALVSKSLRPAFAHATVLEASGLPAEVQFYRFVHSDCLAICRDELNVTSIALQPDVAAVVGPALENEREAVVDIYQRMIAAAARSGAFDVPQTELATQTAFGMVESIARWYSVESDLTPEMCADQVTRSIICGLLPTPSGFGAIVAQAAHAPAATESGSQIVSQ
ncbi:MAG: TetR/AcrR family transcriptional regulator [Actinobacteria bacterium]|nr:TetR/AcrR family transcriptional regulator [Actinomycetota bacterium]